MTGRSLLLVITICLLTPPAGCDSEESVVPGDLGLDGSSQMDLAVDGKASADQADSDGKSADFNAPDMSPALSCPGAKSCSKDG